MTSVQTKRFMTFAILPASVANFDDHMAEFFPDLDTARDAAFDWSIQEGGDAITVWRLTAGNPIKWLEVVA